MLQAVKAQELGFDGSDVLALYDYMSRHNAVCPSVTPIIENMGIAGYLVKIHDARNAYTIQFNGHDAIFKSMFVAYTIATNHILGIQTTIDNTMIA